MNGGDIPVEELFNMFFNGGGVRFAGGGRRQQQNQRQQHQQQRQENDPRGGNLAQLFQLLPVILLIIMAFTNLTGGGQQAAYSFHKEGIYQVPMATKSNGVIRDIPYFVSTSFDGQYPRHTYNFQRVEKMVEQDFRDLLVNRCYNERGKRNSLIQKVCVANDTGV
jgi:hypothetical protein